MRDVSDANASAVAGRPVAAQPARPAAHRPAADLVAYAAIVDAATETRAVELSAHASIRVPDALALLGGGPSGDGAIHDGVVITAPYRWGEQVAAASRSFTAAAGGGTYGHAVTATPGRAGYSIHLVWPGEPEPDWRMLVPFHLAYAGASNLNADRRVPGQMRHNLGVVNDFDDAVTLTLLWGYMEGETSWPQ
jgi:hypothetical protein